MTSRHSHILPKLMEPLQMLKFHIRSGRTLNFTEGLSRQVQVLELETENANEFRVAEDITTFIQSLLDE
ncbi:hypothetical protein BDQ17DRAFT_1247233 [Cyathus striatus]|nr:hypothetical protein BDQ17DRAFT_1247233 [Cyathus striatus]